MKRATFGPYELVRKLAAGGMADVFLARRWGDAGFFRDLVVKRLFSHLGDHPETLSMFQFEAKLMAQFHHPNIPQVYDLGQADGHWYMAMEYVEGPTVADLWRGAVRADLWVPIPVVAGIVRQLARALQHVHECRDRGGHRLQIVHRDVTPHNILLTRDGIVKLVDFGVAQTVARPDSEPGNLRGTLSYMAPEQVQGHALDQRADVFALGVILYELTTGTRLFEGGDVEVMTSVVERDATPPSVHFPGYPADLEELVMAAIARDRSKRIASAQQVADRLDAHAARHGVGIGASTVAEFVRQVFPYTKAKEPELALVPEPGPAEPEPSVAMSSESTESSMFAEFDNLQDDVEMVHAIEAPRERAGTPGPSVPPPLPGALPNLDEPVEGPPRRVVLFSKLSDTEDSERYLRDLAQRLEAEDG